LSRFSAGVGPLLLATSLLLLLGLPGLLGLRTTGLVLGWTRGGMLLVRLVLLQGVELTLGLGELGLGVGQARLGLLLLSLALTIRTRLLLPRGSLAPLLLLGWSFAMVLVLRLAVLRGGRLAVHGLAGVPPGSDVRDLGLLGSQARRGLLLSGLARRQVSSSLVLSPLIEPLAAHVLGLLATLRLTSPVLIRTSLLSAVNLLLGGTVLLALLGTVILARAILGLLLLPGRLLRLILPGRRLILSGRLLRLVLPGRLLGLVLSGRLLGLVLSGRLLRARTRLLLLPVLALLLLLLLATLLLLLLLTPTASLSTAIASIAIGLLLARAGRARAGLALLRLTGVASILARIGLALTG
jgi:hypothetical protein